jgi:hypothetical protein
MWACPGAYCESESFPLETLSPSVDGDWRVDRGPTARCRLAGHCVPAVCASVPVPVLHHSKQEFAEPPTQADQRIDED